LYNEKFMRKNTIVLFALLATGLISCRKTDKEKPTFSWISPTDSLVVEAGSAVSFNATFFDNEALSQYKIDIHDNFDGHGHDKYIAQIWSRIIIGNLSGIEQSENFVIQVPDSAAAGWYHFLLTAADASGNQSEFGLRSLYVRNDMDTVAPSISLASPTENQTLALGSGINLNANITDNERVYIITTRVRRPNSSNTLYQSNDTLANPVTQFNLIKEIPTGGAAWTNGNYVLTVSAFDSYFNKITKTVNLQLN
jgi:hypothetical protein